MNKLLDNKFGIYFARDKQSGKMEVFKHIPPGDDEWIDNEDEAFLLMLGVDCIPHPANDLQDDYDWFGPITPEMAEAWDPAGHQMSIDLLTEIHQTACISKNAAAELIKNAESGLTIRCPTCGRTLESSLDLRYCQCSKPVCIGCAGGDLECLICLECGEVTSEIEPRKPSTLQQLLKNPPRDIDKLIDDLAKGLTRDECKRLINALKSQSDRQA